MCPFSPFVPYLFVFCVFLITCWYWKTGRLLSVIKRSRDRFKALVDLSPYGIALTSKDGKIVSANKALADLLGRDIRTLMGASMPQLLGLDAKQIERDHAGLKPGEILKLPGLHLTRSNGKVYHLRPCLFFHETHSDLLFWHIQDQTTYFELEKRFEELVESVPVGLFWSDLKGHIRAVNPGFKEIFASTNMPSNLQELLSKELWDEVQKVIISKDNVFKTQIEVTDKNKTKYLKMELKICHHGASNYLAGILKDETLEHELQQELEAAYKKAEAASRAKSVFLSQMSHEFRTPLNVIMGMATLLEDKITDSDALELVSDLKRASEHLTSLIGDILDLAKIESGRLTLDERPFDLKDLMDDVSNVLGIQARLKDLEFKLDFPKDTHRFFKGDPVRIRQIIFNLAGNAIKLTQKGWIEIGLSCRGKDEVIKIIEIRVTDTGPGIPEDILPELFKPFVQAEDGRRAGGTGLGLSIARELAELMGGSISVESELGKGTTFTVQITLQAVDASLIPETSPSHHIELVPGTAIIADDVQMNRKILKAFLEKKGWRIFEASDGIEVLEILKQGHNIDVVFMDISMPRMDGMEAVKQIKQNKKWQDIPIIAVTAHAMAEDRKRFLGAGMDGYVSKPIRPDQLFKEMNRVLSERIAYQDKSVGISMSEPKVSSHVVDHKKDKTQKAEISTDDPVDYKALVATCQGMDELASELLKALFDECPKWIEDAERAVASLNPKEIRKICHLIRGSASTMHAHELNSAAEALGKAAREGKAEMYTMLLEALKEAALRLQNWIKVNICLPSAINKLEDVAQKASKHKNVTLQQA